MNFVCASAAGSTYTNEAAAAVKSRNRLMAFCPLKTTARPVIFSESLPHASTEPLNATAPMKIVMHTETAVTVLPSPELSQNCAYATNAEASPPKPFSKATNSGIPVIFTFFAQTMPIAEPITSAAAIHIYPFCIQSVVFHVCTTSFSKNTAITAVSIPKADSILP
jgi:hypothetical protein